MSTHSYVDTILHGATLEIKMGSPDAYLARSIRRLFGLWFGGCLPLGERSVQGNGHGGFTAQEITPAQLDFGPSFAFASQPNAFGVDSNRVIHAVDCDLPLEFFVQDGSHVWRTPLREKVRTSNSALVRLGAVVLWKFT